MPSFATRLTTALVLFLACSDAFRSNATVLNDLQDKKSDIPDDAALKEAEKTIKSLFKEDYAKRSPADRIALAKNLLKQGVETKDSPAARYVLFRESQEIAAKAGDIETA